MCLPACTRKRSTWRILTLLCKLKAAFEGTLAAHQYLRTASALSLFTWGTCPTADVALRASVFESEAPLSCNRCLLCM